MKEMPPTHEHHDQARCPEHMPYWTSADPGELSSPRCVDVVGHPYAHQAHVGKTVHSWGDWRLIVLPWPSAHD